MAARASVAFITDQVEEVKQRQFVDLVPGIVQVRAVMSWGHTLVFSVFTVLSETSITKK